MPSFFTKGLHAALSILFPLKCLSCGTRIISSTEIRNYSNPKPNHFSTIMAAYLCNKCISLFNEISSPICVTCGKPFISKEGDDRLCDQCIRGGNHFSKARSVGIYDHSFRQIIHHYKYKNRVYLSKPLAQLIEKSYLTYWQSNEIDIVIPVPLHIKRFRQRGFNQAYLLIRQWEKNTQTQFPILDQHALIRTRWTDPMVRLSKKQRVSNLKNAFCVSNPKAIHHKRILLIDDVFTTGVTVNECTKVLLKAGAKRVDILTLARVIL